MAKKVAGDVPQEALDSLSKIDWNALTPQRQRELCRKLDELITSPNAIVQSFIGRIPLK